MFSGEPCECEVYYLAAALEKINVEIKRKINEEI